MVELRKLTFRYPSSTFALAIDSLDIEHGERLAIVGPSGSGKTTLLSLLAGILVPQSGSIAVDGTQLNQLSDWQRRDFRASSIGMVFQQFELLQYLNVLENVRLPFRFGRFTAKGLSDGPAMELLESVGLDGFKRYPDQLSRGEQQRVAICRALVTEPKLILADEPTGNLDPVNKLKIMDLLFEQTTSRNQTLVVVTHDHSLLQDFDRVIDFETFLHSDANATGNKATAL